MKLTSPNPELDRLASQTPAGMAHWAGTGPAGKTCRECLFYKNGNTGYYSINSKFGPVIKPRACDKYERMMRRLGPLVPPNSAACKYFEQNPSPPPIKDPHR